MTNQVPVTFIDNPHAPEVFAFRASGIALFADNIHLTFEAPRVDHATSPGPINRVVVRRLVLPLSGAEALRDLLIDYIKNTKAGMTAPQAPDPRTLN